MNTGLRRFILRVIVGLLTFVVGVAAAMLLGGFQPFQGFAASPSYNYRYEYRHEYRTDPDYQYPVYHEHGCRARGRLGQTPPPPPMMDAPLPPEPPRPVR